jgi:hypothetical protein
MRRLLAGLIAAAALALSCSGGGDGGVGTSDDGPSGPQSVQAVRATVAYKVTGNAPQVDIRYGNKHHSRRVQVQLPWTHGGSAFTGTTVILAANQPRSRFGYRLQCVLTVTIPDNAPIVNRDSSHIVGIKQEGGPQKILYDGQCNTEQVISLTGLP